MELLFWEKFVQGATHRNDPRDNHDDGEDKADDEDISFAVERTLLVLEINLEVMPANFAHHLLLFLATLVEVVNRDWLVSLPF